MKVVSILIAAAGALVCFSATAQTNVQSLSLDAAFDRALATDQNIGIAIEEIKKAKLVTWSAASTVGPKVTGNATYTHPERDITGTQGPLNVDTRFANIVLQQPLFDPQIFAALRSGKLSAEAAKLAFKSTVRTVLFGVTQAYYDVLKQQHVVEVNRDTLKLAHEQFGLAERRYNVGVAVKTDMLRARVQVEQANRAVTESENALQLAQTVLANVLNLGSSEIGVSEPDAASPTKDTLEDLQKRAFERREDFLAGRIAIRQSEENVNLVKADYGPRVSGQFSYQWIDPETQSQKSDFWLAGIAVQWPIFNGGRRSVDLRNAAYQKSEAELRQENLEKAVDQDVRAAWLNVHALEKTLVAVRAQVDAAAENYKDLQSQYQAGAATSLDVMTALNDLNAARRDLTTQTYDYQIALLNIDRATGTFQDARVEKIKTP